MFNWNRFYREAEAGGAGGEPAGGAPAGGAPAGGAPSGAWHEKLGDQGLVDFATTKGFTKGSLDEVAPQMLRSYHNLEKLFGADKAGRTVEVPDFEKADDIAKGQFFERIGRPKTDAEYDLALPKDAAVDPTFEKWARTTFHKEGLTSKQANALGKSWNEFTGGIIANQTAEAQTQAAAEDKALRTAWGAAYDDKFAKASAVAKNLGFKPDVIDTIQKSAGFGATMEMFAKLAEKLGEDNFVAGSGEGGGGTMTPAEAKAELSRLTGDKDWMESWLNKNHPKHKDALARKTFLASMISAGKEMPQ